MIKIEFNRNEPTGDIIINLPEMNILRGIWYVTDHTFHYNYGTYEKCIDNIEKENKYDVLVIVNDNSSHPYHKRCMLKAFTFDELKNN